jgi:two-component system, LytTR family, response regulator
MITTIAIDDEPVALDIIRDHARQIPFINLIKTFSSAQDALAYTRREDIQLVFIDINMPDMSGLEFAELVRHKSLVIFTTAYPEYALQGYELAATDYLLKPITYTRFLKACELAEKRVPTLSSVVPQQDAGLFVKDGYNWIKINTSDLLYAKSDDNYVSLFEDKRRTVTRMTLSKLLSKLPKHQFVQVHKSFIVAISKIEKVEHGALVIAGQKIPVSNYYKEELLKAIEIYNLKTGSLRK